MNSLSFKYSGNSSNFTNLDFVLFRLSLFCRWTFISASSPENLIFVCFPARMLPNINIYLSIPWVSYWPVPIYTQTNSEVLLLVMENIKKNDWFRGKSWLDFSSWWQGKSKISITINVCSNLKALFFYRKVKNEGFVSTKKIWRTNDKT